ncbi:iron ABC transporter permease [Membranicola marinus]|uniref:Iron ABC transporter permease n=2 Tax=Membranihabitans marinus TaxID=1227546 RepID=A0A953L7B4_9BACT|nr:iron ABC transporter permease [Membranihabitans marinus]
MMKQDGHKDLFSWKNRLKRFKRDNNRWSMYALAIAFLIALPIFAIGFKLFSGPGETWSHIVQHLLWDYTSNSLFLFLVCGLMVVVIGVTCAWLISRYEFPFRPQLEWLLILPLAIPSYIVAYAYAGIFDYGGSLELILRYFELSMTKVDIMNRFGLAFVLSISLFPYVYVSARAFFLNQANNLLEASRMLGAGEGQTFFKLMLPLARPAIIAGLILVLMEVLNDYGAAKYYGVNTFTTGIFRAWFSIGEPETAVYLSALLIVIVFSLILLERWERKNVRVSDNKSNSGGINRIRPARRWKRWMIFIPVFVPVLLGFILPVSQLIYWATLTADKVLGPAFFQLSLQSFGIALIASLFAVILATFLIYFSKWSPLPFIQNVTKIGVLGYAIPGAVIAVGVLIPALGFDKWLIKIGESLLGIDIGLIFTGSLVVLIYAYCVRFLAVAYNPIESTSQKVGQSIPDSSKMLGVGNAKTFFRVEFPLIKTGIFSAFILVFIDVLKELPLTLILKPFRVNTLAVKAYEYASDEMVMESAIPSLLIIVTAVLPVILLNRLLLNR